MTNEYMIVMVFEQDADAPKRYLIVNRDTKRVHTVWASQKGAESMLKDLNLFSNTAGVK